MPIIAWRVCSQADVDCKGRNTSNDLCEAWQTFGRETHPGPNFASFDLIPKSHPDLGLYRASAASATPNRAGRGWGAEARARSGPTAAGVMGLAGGAGDIVAAIAADAASEELEREWT